MKNYPLIRSQKSKAINKGRYRPEIDGLRAFAVIAVIINHFNKSILASGYLGVDIFFVISGYVITSSLADRDSKGFLDFISDFYERRIRRLVPALIAFLVPTAILICLFNPDSRLALRTAMSSLFGLSNLYLLHQTNDYFAESTELNPFTHTWSLAVEEQFYILFPLIIWFSGFGRKCMKGSRNLFTIISVLFVSSLILFFTLSRTNEIAGYYLMPSRFWEMAAGCLIFLISQKSIQIPNILSRINPMLFFIGIIIIFFQSQKYYLFNTTFIVFATSCLILSIRKDNLLFKFLTNDNMIFIGKISYSLYLWHWGILCLSRWTVGIHIWSFPFQIGLIFIIAYISYRYVESPFREKKPWLLIRWRNILGGITLMISSLFPMLFLWDFQIEESKAGGIYLGNYQEGIALGRDPLLNNYGELTSRLARNCHTSDTKKYDSLKGKMFITSTFIKNCAWDPVGENSRMIAFIGDSHTLSMFPMSEKFAKDFNLSVFSHSRDNCAFPAQGETIRKGCNQVQKSMEKYVLDEFSSRNKGSILVTSSYLNIHFGYFSQLRKNFKKYPKGDRWSVDMNIKDYINALENLAVKLKKTNSSLIILAPLPSHPLYKEQLCNPEWYRPKSLISKGCSVTSTEFLKKQRKHIYEALKNLEYKNSNIFIYDAFDPLCDDKFCYVNKDSTTLFVDDDHLNKKGIEYIYPNFVDFLRIKEVI